MKLFLRLVRYLLPSKGKVALVVVVSMISSLLGVVSIYSVLPLLNAVFTADRSIEALVHPGAASLAEKKPAKNGSTSSGAFHGIDTEKLKASVTDKFGQIFHAETRERTLLKIHDYRLGQAPL
jgi:ATP-binding cassette, subfamily B, bacterial MsbA